MRKNLSVWQLGGMTFATALGTLLHFIYDWTGWLFATPFSAVNESTWEHMKILFFPMLLFAVFQYFFFRKEYPAFWWIKLIGIVIGTSSIPLLFYTWSGAFGPPPGVVNVLFFFVSAGLAYYVEFLLFKKNFTLKAPYIAFIALLIIAALFVVLTFFPPRLPLFQDPIDGTYGVKAARIG